MSSTLSPKPDQQPTVYEIRVRGNLSPDWADWFGDLTVAPQEDGDTLLTGPVVDQAALHGLLKRVRDLGITLLSVNLVEPAQGNAPKEE
jgi:hypothetical protein